MSDEYLIKSKGDLIAIIVPRSEVHALRVALKPVSVGEVTSKATQDIRDRLDKGLARIVADGRRQLSERRK